jgi:outer membrane lipoprotein-sorting protein
VNIFRRLPLFRLLTALAVTVVVAVSATALAFALGAGPTPPAEPLADAIHGALVGAGGETVQGVSANITFTDHLLEGANLASGGKSSELTSSPLITGASGRLWVAKDGDMRLELQSEQGDTQILYDGHTLQLYDAATNTLYRYTPPAQEEKGASEAADREAPKSRVDQLGVAQAEIQADPADSQSHEVPSVAKIEEAIASLKHVDVSGATPTDVAGQPAYTVRVSPKEGGSLLAGAELSFDADNGVPLRSAIYSTDGSAPVLELAASEISFGPVDSSIFAITPPSNAKVQEISFSNEHKEGVAAKHAAGERPKLSTSGHGPGTVAVLTTKSNGAKDEAGSLEGLSKVTINGTSASVLRTELGTLLTFERSGVRYLVAGAVSPAAVEEVARGL